MKFLTIDDWDEELWQKAEAVYNQAFPEHGRKNKQVIRNLFRKNLSELHVITRDGPEVIAMAITGNLTDIHVVLIDYLAVSEPFRNQGIGQMLVNYIKDRARKRRFDGMLVEVESWDSEINRRRIRFWEKCGFQMTDYDHTYRWVPEPYRAMYLDFQQTSRIPRRGEILFQHITKFHKAGYRGM